MQVYDPKSYWDSRENPNHVKTPALGEGHTRFLLPYFQQADSILDLGPGIGRLMPAYKLGSCREITTLDITRRYAEELRQTAAQNGVEVKQHYLDDPTDAFPFNDQAFGLGVSFSVFLHIPFDMIKHTIGELGRVCEKVVCVVGANPNWPSSKEECPPDWHCFRHDYKAICADLGFEVSNLSMNGNILSFEYKKAS